MNKVLPSCLLFRTRSSRSSGASSSLAFSPLPDKNNVSVPVGMFAAKPLTFIGWNQTMRPRSQVEFPVTSTADAGRPEIEISEGLALDVYCCLFSFCYYIIVWLLGKSGQILTGVETYNRSHTKPSKSFAERFPSLITDFFFLMWYCLNVIFNILNKKACNYFTYPYFVSVMHLLVGVAYCLVSWAIGLPKRAVSQLIRSCWYY